MLVQLPEGCSVVVRPMGPADHDLLAGFGGLDSPDHDTMGAIDPMTGQAVGVARFLRNSARPQEARAEVAVISEWQGRGVGRVLLNHLARRARRQGIEIEDAPAAQRVLSTAVRASAS